jgi:hypothetical protein
MQKEKEEHPKHQVKQENEYSVVKNIAKDSRGYISRCSTGQWKI